MRRAAAGLIGLLGAGLLAAPHALAAGCAAQKFGAVTVRIDDDELVAEAGGKALSQIPLPVVGSAWRCLNIQSFPSQRLLFIEWHQGEAGTFQIFHRVSLLVYSIGEAGIHPRGDWTLRQGYRGKGPDIIEAARTYRLEPRELGVEVVLEGTQRITIEPK